MRQNLIINLAKSVTKMQGQLRTFLFCSIIVLCAILAFSFRASSEIYKWVDEKGVVHFSDSPPPDREAEKLKERPIDKIGGTETIPPKASERYSASSIKNQISYLEERIKYYETEIEKCEKDIEDYQQKIKELEKKEWDLPNHYRSHSEGDYYDRLRKSYDSRIEGYQKRIKEKENLISEYGNKIVDLKNELNELRFKEVTTPKE
jgi:hypothetical protein